MTDNLYRDIPLTNAYPDLEQLGLEFRSSHQNLADAPAQAENAAAKMLLWISRLIRTDRPLNICDIGCGHRPLIIRSLMNAGHKVVGVEPVLSYVESARKFLGCGSDIILKGAAEDIPLPDRSQDVVLFQSVLEHVDSVSLSLRELFRITRPGGILYLNTTNRHRLPILGLDNEFRVKLYPFLPKVLKEAFVFHHLHYDPSLANYSTRPAVHWFTYPELCALGREAGFSRFYSLLDVAHPEDPAIARSRLRLAVLRAVKRHPWLRALVLTQEGGNIFMYRMDTGDEKF